jgi:hypothetical protein
VLILLVSCTAKSDFQQDAIVETSEPPDISGGSEVVQATQSAQIDRETVERSDRFRKEYIYGDYILHIGHPGDDNSNETLTCKLTNPSEEYDSLIVISDRDELVHYSVFENAIPLEVNLDINTRSATITIEKTNYILDFDSGEYLHEIKYRKEDLREELRITGNKDNSSAIYENYIFYVADLYWSDIVAFNSESDEIVFLVNRYGLMQAMFCDSTSVLICRPHSVDIFNVHTGEKLATSPKFDNGDYNEERGGDEYYALGAAYDEERQIVLVAYREYANIWTLDSICKVYIAVFDQHGEKIDDIDTGFMIAPWYGNSEIPVDIELLGNGKAYLSSREASSEYSIISLGEISY